MPNINEFVEQCSLLGIDHIEVVPVDVYDDTAEFEGLSNDEAVRLIKTKEKISDTIYKKYKETLNTSNIVFFLNNGADVSEEVVFLGNSIILGERGGGNPDESWTYNTHEVDIPLKAGVRTFNEAFKDEIVASGILGIVADSLDDMEGTITRDSKGIRRGIYKESSLYGKLEAKVQAKMKEAGQWDETTQTGDLSGVKIPWLYNLTLMGEPIAGYNHIYLPSGFSGILDYSTYYNSSAANYIWAFYSNLYEYSQNVYKYGFQMFYTSGRRYINSVENISKIINKDYLEFFIPNKNYEPGTSSDRPIYDHGADIGKYKGYLYGGYNAPHISAQTTTGTDNISYVYYDEQPFLIGHILWITSIQPNIEPPRASGYLTIVAFNKQGKIIRPLCPYWTKEGNTWTEYSEDIKDTLELMPDFSPYSPLEGKNLLELCLPLTEAEALYAQNQDYVIVPTDYVPDNWKQDP